MEPSVPLACDSFSYSWYSNCKSPTDGLEELHREPVYSSYGGTSEEFNFTVENTEDLLAECEKFNFDVSVPHSPLGLVPADEIFSDGLLRPMFVEPSKVAFCNTPDPTQTKHSSSFSCRTFSERAMETHPGLLTRWRKSTRRTLVDLARYVNRLRRKVRCSRKSIRVDDIDKTDWQVKCLSSSQKGSPKTTITTDAIGDLHDHENSIYEAVLYCKRSIGIVILFFMILFLFYYVRVYTNIHPKSCNLLFSFQENDHSFGKQELVVEKGSEELLETMATAD